MMEKAKQKISNWKQYNQALVNRVSVTFWIEVAAIKALHFLKHQGHHGRGFIFSDTKIETALMVKGIFQFPPRELKGFLNSFFTLMHFPPESLTYTCISKRSKIVKVKYRLPS